MRNWLVGLGVALVCLLASWGLLLLLARRLPPGILRDLAAFIPDCLTTIRRLRKDPQVPRRAKIAIIIAGLWVLSPIDLIPEFIPVIGPLDDIVVVAFALRYAGRQVPREVRAEITVMSFGIELIPTGCPSPGAFRGLHTRSEVCWGDHLPLRGR